MNIEAISSQILDKIPEPPQSSVILGSGLGTFVDSLKDSIKIPYSEIQNFPISTVSGHKGEWVYGYINDIPIICASGRFHYYEGLTLEEVALPVSFIHSLGCKSVIITNASGCLKKEWQIGDFMLLTGYLDYTFRKDTQNPPIVSINKNHLFKKAVSSAYELDISIRKGNYAWVLGPSFETPAEIQEIISLNGNAVGMSTIPEIKKAIQLEMDVLGLACLTNYGAGMPESVLTHNNVIEKSNRFSEIFSKLLMGILKD